MKEKTDLSLVYALKEYARVNGESDPIIDNRCFTFDDIKAAFNAGRESVVESAMESIPEFKWRGVHHPDRDFVAAYPCDCRYLIEFTRRDHLLFYNRQFIANFASFSQAKQAANEDYKKRIKQALGYEQKRVPCKHSRRLA